jgi:Sap, sulfolipid-1-addressing protein
MPPQALALAFAASIYPPAVAAVIALGRGPQLRSRVFAFVLAAGITTYATGTVMLLLLEELGATSTQNRSAGAGIDLALGVLLLLLAARLYSKRPDPNHPSPAADAATPKGPSKIERYLESRRLAFVLGITLYIVPSPIYIGAVKAIADAQLSASSELLALVATVATMLWMIELPMLMLLVVPARAEGALESVNLWFARNGRMVAVVAAVAVGVYLVVRGLVDLPG